MVFNQPLQLTSLVKDATNKQFLWRVVNGGNTYLNDVHLQNPIAIFPASVDSITYSVKAFTIENCFALDTIKVKIFKTIPSIFIPSAFTPNGDTKNDIIKPICVGITKLDYFNIYNRWGQLLFTTSQINKGWDGAFNGTAQATGTFVYTVQGLDYLGNIITKKGTLVLIR